MKTFASKSTAPPSVAERFPRFRTPTDTARSFFIWVRLARGLAVLVALLLLDPAPARAVDFHVATAQDLQNALTLAAANGADDTIYLTNGYYMGNFNYSSAEAHSLTLQAEPGVTNPQVTIDGAGTGRSVNLSCSAAANITVEGITVLRNCGGAPNAGLRISTVNTADVLVQNCRFLSPTNACGTGVEIVSGRDAAIVACNITGNGQSDTGRGVAISGIARNITVLNNSIANNSQSGAGGGVYVLGASGVIFSNNTIRANSACGNSYGGGAYVESAANVVFSGNTIASNVATYPWNAGYGGGGISIWGGSTATLSNNTITGNTSHRDGGGLVVSVPSVIVACNTVSFNTSDSDANGGGAVIGGTVATLYNNSFIGNVGGGGAYIIDTTVTLNSNAFTGNTGTYGGVYVNGTTATLNKNTFIANSSSSGGGGALINSSRATLNENWFYRNQAMPSGQGGGLKYDNWSSSRLSLSNNVFAGNSSSIGGGLWMRAITNELLNNTITQNASSGVGGGTTFQVDGVVERLYVYNNIIWGNTATGNGVDVYLAGTGSRKEFLNNDAHGMYGVWDIALNNLDVAPMFFDPVNGDYHLRNGSPCINAGSNVAGLLFATDLDGGPRIVNGTVDLGCYEFSTSATHPADTNRDFVLTGAEFNAYAAAWKNAQAWTNAPTVIPADYVTRAGYLMTTNGGRYHNDGSARPVNWKTGP